MTNLLQRDRAPGDEAGDQIPFRADEVINFRCNAKLPGSQVGCVFEFPVDPQEVGTAPAMRRTNASPPTSIRKLLLVIPPPRGVAFKSAAPAH